MTLPTSTTRIERVEVAAFVIPTDLPESDGTFEWNQTTIVTVEITAGGSTGLGFTYADRATARFVLDHFRDVLIGRDPMDVRGAWNAMVRSTRNVGRQGVGAMAVSAADIALWDLKARLLDVPVAALMSSERTGVVLYGSGGFTSYTDEQLSEQLASWAAQGIARVKMKVGRDPEHDPDRVCVAREAIGDEIELFVDANGAYPRARAIEMAAHFADFDVRWFEEPVSSDDLEGLRAVRARAPLGMDVTAGEYAYDAYYVKTMLEAGAVDVMQLDCTRCGGFTGFLECVLVADAFQCDVSAHCAPTLHAHVGCAAPRLRHVEYFHDHARIEPMMFQGVPQPEGGVLSPDRTRPGLGLSIRRADAQRFAA